MNARPIPRKLCTTPALLVLAFSLAAGNAVAVTYDLVAMPFNKAVPGGSVPMWGFALDDGSPDPSVPGPALVVPPGDNSLTVNLRNALSGPGAEAVSIVIPGQIAAMVPVKFTDGSGRQRVRSFAAEAPVGGTQAYTWNNLRPGTYLYHSGTHPQVQVQMGLYGAMTHDAAAGQAYPGVTYTSEVPLLFSEIDPDLHLAVANGQYGEGMPVSSTIDYHPRWFLINGEPYTGPGVPLPAGSAGQPTLLRLLNAGLQSRSPMLQGQHMRLVAEDGNPYPHARNQYAVFLPALKTVDAVVIPAAATTYPLYDRRLALTNPGSADTGGMLALLTVAGAPGGAPSTVNDAYPTDEDTALNVPAPGVLTNDTPGSTAILASGTSHGTLSLAADGSFSYSPQANYNGTDTFTYQASSGGLTSVPAIVTLTVNPVNDAPVAGNDTYSVPAGTVLNVAAPGLLANDTDVDGDGLTAVNASALAGLAVNTDGSFSYNASTAGNYSFTYQASDGIASSSAATVAITVIANEPPVAVNDTVSAPRRTTAPYTPVIITVLANDSDPNGNLDPTTVAIVTPPNKGGLVTVNPSGTVSYTPRLNFRGAENFRYRVCDTGGLCSNAATVKVNVK